MLRRAISSVLGPETKRRLKTLVNSAHLRFIKMFRSYGSTELVSALRSMGIREDDTLMVHANFRAESGFRGTPADVVNALVEQVVPRGNLVMVSIPFRGTAYDHLAAGKPFNLRKTVSMMGMVSEMFRRRIGTRRSLHPTHPVLAVGKDADELVAGHAQCRTPCGAGTPFEKIRQRRGKILFHDVGFGAVTFFHHVEDLLKDKLPRPVYDERVFSVTVIDENGVPKICETVAFNTSLIRDAPALEKELVRRNKLQRRRVGNAWFIVVSCEDVVETFAAMVAEGHPPYRP